ncbi:MAG: hypothetical protein QXV21_03200 [Candidatus Bathyarchaeia archaeon]
MGWRYTPRGWWCPRHPWPPAWARAYAYQQHTIHTQPSHKRK